MIPGYNNYQIYFQSHSHNKDTDHLHHLLKTKYTHYQHCHNVNTHN